MNMNMNMYTYVYWVGQKVDLLFSVRWLQQHLVVFIQNNFVTLYFDSSHISVYLKNTYQDFQSRWQHRQTQFTSSHNHIKITSEIQNNHHSELSGTELNRSLTTMELKKPHPPRLGGVEMQNGLIPHPCVVDKNSGAVSWERGDPVPHQAPQPMVPVSV